MGMFWQNYFGSSYSKLFPSIFPCDTNGTAAQGKEIYFLNAWLEFVRNT